MVTVIKKDMKPKEIEAILEKRRHKINSEKELEVKKHFGSLKRGLDGLAYQKEVRNDWE